MSYRVRDSLFQTVRPDCYCRAIQIVLRVMALGSLDRWEVQADNRSMSGSMMYKFWWQHVCTLLALLGVSLLVGCAGGASNSNSTTAGALAVSPSTLNFGNVAIGQSSTLTGTLSATNADVTISSAAWSGSGYSLSGITFPVTIPAGKNANYTVTFEPPSAGSSQGSISFASNASDPSLTQSFSGDGTQAGQHSVALSWNASTSTVAGYNVYRGTQFGGPYSKLNSSLIAGTSYSDSSVQSATTYYYVSTAVNSSSVESGYSNQATAVIP
jgi:hypothetical protein